MIIKSFFIKYTFTEYYYTVNLTVLLNKVLQ